MKCTAGIQIERHHTLMTVSRSRLKPASVHSYTAPSAPALARRVSSWLHTMLRTLPLWPLHVQAKHSAVTHGGTNLGHCFPMNVLRFPVRCMACIGS